jgi:hypothetical protein
MLGLILPPCCHIFLSYIIGFDIKIIHHVDVIAMLTSCYSIMSHGTHIHVNVAYLNVMCTLVATSVISRKLECSCK